MRDNDRLICEICEIIDNKIRRFDDGNSLILAIRARDLCADVRCRAELLQDRRAGDELADVARLQEIEDLLALHEQLQAIEIVFAKIAAANGRPLTAESDDPGQRRRGVRVEWPSYWHLVSREAWELYSEELKRWRSQVERLKAEVERLKAEAAAGASQPIPLGREPLTVDPLGEAKARPSNGDRPPVVWIGEGQAIAKAIAAGPAGPIFPRRGDK